MREDLSLLLKGIVLLNNGVSAAEVKTLLAESAHGGDGDGSCPLQDCGADVHLADIRSDAGLISAH